MNKFKEAGLKYVRSGCSLVFQKRTESTILLFANNSNYKILFICASFLASTEERFYIVKDDNIDVVLSIISMDYRVRKGEKDDAD